MDKFKLTVFSDKSEEIDYNFPDFPLYVRAGRLEHFNMYKADNHWHDDLEFVLVTEGEIEYFVNGEIVVIKKGQCIFVNSKRMHYGFSSHMKPCSFIVIAIHPTLFNSFHHAYQSYWKLKFGGNTQNYLIFSSDNNISKSVLQLITELYDHVENKRNNSFYLISKSAELIYLVGEQLNVVSNIDEHRIPWNNFVDMKNFIFDNYDQKIMIEDIAASGQVCRSHCYNLFHEYTMATPIDYLNQYRLKRAVELLKNTKRTILEIALSSGFQTNSYFTYYFNKTFGITPKEYRKIQVASSL